ncbi:hypothetical protein PRZ48_005492 [Zasmidium cellare]|uniref:Uncharacterized protein n=1 Tax=Zasmidium cellare TaxID=395010 RepID=A0ABR0EU12_ZASCE|nr:hypothetical protein PRZ48_005492 [Zasmidium cellare]
MLRSNSTATPAPSERDSASTTSTLPPIAANTDLRIVLSRTKSLSTIKTKLKAFLFGAKRPITLVKIEAILTSEAEVREFWKEYIRADESLERRSGEVEMF